MNPKDINKLQLEGLVKAGAFDEIEKNRIAMLKSIPNLIQINKSISEEKFSNQKNLFDSNSATDIKILKLDNTKPWTNNEKLMNEFQSIGFYMSDHPLNVYRDYFIKTKISSFKNFFNGNEMSARVAGTIMSIQEKKVLKEHHLL